MRDFQKWKKKIQKRMIWSDPMRSEEFDSFVGTSQKVCTEAIFDKHQLSLYQKQRAKNL